MAGALLGPLLAVQVGMGEEILILAFVVIVIGGLGSIKGALVGALLVGIADTLGRILLPDLFGLFTMPVNTADHGLHLVLSVGSIAAGLASSRDRATA